MSNEAAERLIELMEPHEKRWIEPRLKEALAAERKATVERIRAAAHRDVRVIPEIGEQVSNWIDAVLDAEAGR